MKCLAAAASALILAACGDSTVCSLVGCNSQAAIRLHDLSPALSYPLTAHACFDERCADATIEREPPPADEQKGLPCPAQGRASCLDLRSTEGYVAIVFSDPSGGTREHTAGLDVRDAGGALVVHSTEHLRLVKLAPNGEKCGPICWSGAADFR